MKVASPLIEAALTRNNTIPVFSSGSIRVSPRKLNLLSRLIRNMSLDDAKLQMHHTLKRSGKPIEAMIKRISCSLKHNYNVDPSDFFVKQSWVGKGMYLKRVSIHGKGRAGVMHHPSAHLKIMVEESKKLSTEQQEMADLLKLYKKRKLFISVQDKRPVNPAYPIWSKKPWKYVTSKKWISPDNAKMK